MDELINKFSEQLAWMPVVENTGQLAKTNKFIVCGMGGSALAAGLWKVAEPKLDLLIHRDYGLPRVPDYFLRESLIILSSYSGNTAEVLDTAEQALKGNLKIAVIASGGKLLDWAKNHNTAYVLIPGGLPSRLALGYACKALGALLGDENLAAMSGTTALPTGPLGANLLNTVPVIYSSTKNFPLAYQWKISFNETAKVPAFANALPELNHNEMQSNFGPNPPTGRAGFHFIFLRDESDDAQISKRFEILEKLYRDKNWPVETVNLTGATWQKIWQSVILASWTSFSLAKQQNLDPLAVPLIEEFKKLMG